MRSDIFQAAFTQLSKMDFIWKLTLKMKRLQLTIRSRFSLGG